MVNLTEADINNAWAKVLKAKERRKNLEAAGDFETIRAERIAFFEENRLTIAGVKVQFMPVFDRGEIPLAYPNPDEQAAAYARWDAKAASGAKLVFA